MINGIYIYERTDCCGFNGQIKIRLEETEKLYRIKMLENTTKYDYDHFANIFNGKTSVSIQKSGGNHACTVFPDEDFLIYPFRAGIPFLFRKINSLSEVTSNGTR